MSLKKLLFSVLPIVLLSSCAQHQQGGNLQPDNLLNNVSYSAVVALPVTDNGLQIAYGEEDLQFGRLFLPITASTTVGAPLVIFIHGGCWLNAYDLQHTHAFSQALSQAGFAVWSVEYRRVGDKGGGWPGSFDDVKQAVAFSRTLAKYGVDTNQVSLVGHSAGGHLALLAGSDGITKQYIKAVVGMAAISDFEAYAEGSNSCQQAALQFIGGNALQKPQDFMQANPVKQSLHANTMLLHGSADSIVESAQVQAAGQPYQIVYGAGHFDWIHPNTKAYKVFLNTLKQLIGSETP